MHAATVTYWRWLRPWKFPLEALEGTVPVEVDVPCLSHIPIGRSRME
jgi:hypothetical protein